MTQVAYSESFTKNETIDDFKKNIAADNSLENQVKDNPSFKKFFKKNMTVVPYLIALLIFVVGFISGYFLPQNIVSTDKGNITYKDLSKQMTTNPQFTTQTAMQTILLNKSLETYSNRITQKEVDTKYKETKKQYGDTFEQQLKTSGLTETTFKAQLKTQMALKSAIDQSIEKKYFNQKYYDNYKKSYKGTTPVLIQGYSTKNEANAAIKKGADVFKKSAQDMTLDPNDSQYPTTMIDAVGKLKVNQLSGVISFQGQYYVIMRVGETKSVDQLTNKDIQKSVINKMEADSNFVTSVQQKLIKSINAKAVDKDYKTILSNIKS